jgi:hypothetical protein
MSDRRQESTSKKTLAELYAAHQGKVSHKWSLYIEEYDRLLAPCRDTPVQLLEIGVQNGGSLELWAQFLPSAEKLVGCDVNPRCAQLRYDDPRIAIVVGDANTDATEKAIVEHLPAPNVIIDDGSHVSSDIVRSFTRYFPRLMDGGLFVIEDLHASYWRSFQGGVSHSLSSMAFIKRLADVINHEHWGMAKSRTDYLRPFFNAYKCRIDEEQLARIGSLELLNSMCVIRKADPRKHRLGVHFIAGRDESIVPGHLQLHGSQNRPPRQRKRPWDVIRSYFGR